MVLGRGYPVCGPWLLRLRLGTYRGWPGQPAALVSEAWPRWGLKGVSLQLLRSE